MYSFTHKKQYITVQSDPYKEKKVDPKLPGPVFRKQKCVYYVTGSSTFVVNSGKRNRLKEKNLQPTPPQRPIGSCCLGKQSPSIVTNVQKKTRTFYR